MSGEKVELATFAGSAGAVFEMTPDQQRGEIAAVAQMGGNVVRLHEAGDLSELSGPG